MNGTLSYLVQDTLGSTTMALSSAGGITATQLFAPYGAVRDQSGTMPTSYGYTNQRSDPSGLMYDHARYYDSSVGQFISADQVQGPNRYGYVGGNPTTRTDPSGNTLIPPRALQFYYGLRIALELQRIFLPSPAISAEEAANAVAGTTNQIVMEAPRPTISQAPEATFGEQVAISIETGPQRANQEDDPEKPEDVGETPPELEVLNKLKNEGNSEGGKGSETGDGPPKRNGDEGTKRATEEEDIFQQENDIEGADAGTVPGDVAQPATTDNPGDNPSDSGDSGDGGSWSNSGGGGGDAGGGGGDTGGTGGESGGVGFGGSELKDLND